MRSGVPWSVKGIEPEAREAAKQAARRAGVTLGAWLNQVIMDGGTDEVDRADAEALYRETQSSPAPAQAKHQAMDERIAVDMAPVAEAVRDIVARVEQSEKRTQELARRMEQTVGQIAERLDYSDRHAEPASAEPRGFDPLERKIQQLSERLEQAERNRSSFGRKGADERAQLQTLEKAVNAVVDHLETAERRTDESMAEIRRTLGEIANRVDQHEEEEAREEAEARARAAEDHMKLLAQRLEQMEQSVSGVGPQAVDAALRAIAEKDDEERHKATISQLQTSLSEITQRLERAEKRTEETLKTFELTVTGIARRLEDMDASRDQNIEQALEARVHEANARAQEVETRLEDITARLHQSEEMSLQAAQTIERAIAGMSESLNGTETRSRETIDNLNVMLERMTDRLGRIERETKATRTSLKQTVASGTLSPVLNVGHPHGGLAGNGFVPGGQAFPIPNFDAPSLGGGYDPLPPMGSDFRSPHTQAPAAPHPTPVVTPEHTFATDDLPPPPFAPDAERVEPRLNNRFPDEDELAGETYEEAAAAPVDEPARVAEDFMAAARRAAQAASIQGINGHQGGPASGAYTGAYAPRYAAYDDGESRSKKFIYAGIAAIVVIALAIGTMRLLNNDPVIVSTTPSNENEKVLADMEASTQTSQPSSAATTVPAKATDAETIHPEATPEDAETANEKAASASTTSNADTVVPVAKPKAERAPNQVTQAPPAKPVAPTTPAPSKPVASAPLANVPASERDLRAAAVAGNPAAQYEVGQRYANGENVPQDLSQAAYWYTQAADQGLAIAQYRLAALYEKGRGLSQDDAKARSWYEKAATQGNIKAMHNLAVIYAEGRGTRQDFTTAARWFGSAADYGLGDSQYNLAILQERGLGVPQDLVLAYKWLAIAANGGDKGAATKRDEVGARLDPAKLAQAKQAVQSWSAKRPDPVANGDLSGLGSWASLSPSETTASLSNDMPAAPARNDLANAQAMLIALGYNPGSSDGLMGPRTRQAILDYQRFAGLEQTGSVNRALLKSLEIATR
tara:strand:- start:8915 stop:12013 length:3099 start_codon:yes stop_codon:yes gene_type:complete